jgi:hypothetical protein
MRVVRIFTTATGDSAIEVREVPMSGASRPSSEIFACREIFFTRSLRDQRGFVHVAMADDFDVTGWPLVRP